jgi:hypothetical protein
VSAQRDQKACLRPHRGSSDTRTPTWLQLSMKKKRQQQCYRDLRILVWEKPKLTFPKLVDLGSITRLEALIVNHEQWMRLDILRKRWERYSAGCHDGRREGRPKVETQRRQVGAPHGTVSSPRNLAPRPTPTETWCSPLLSTDVILTLGGFPPRFSSSTIWLIMVYFRGFATFVK